MAKITFLQPVAAAVVACGLSTAPAQAGSDRTFVSGTGTDSGACARAAPCRTFAFALTQTNAAGEIDVLNPGDYGPVTITKGINIINDGVGTAGITAGPGVNGVTINAGASDNVHLRGLTIEGLSGSNGILLNSGGYFAIENCVIQGFNNVGIIILPQGSVTGVLSKVITNWNGGGGIQVDGDAATRESLINVTVVDSVASNNAHFGIEAISSFDNAKPFVMLRNSVATNNGTGLSAVSNAALRVGHSVVAGNAVGVQVATGGVIFTYGDNDIDGNTTDNTGGLTPIVPH